MRFLGEERCLLADVLDDAVRGATTAAAVRLAEIIEVGEERHQLTASRAVLELASRYRVDQALEHRIKALEMAAGLRHRITQ